MPYKVIVKEETWKDIADAMDWYAPKAKNLDKNFLQEVENTISRIRLNPAGYKKVYKTFRQTSVWKFPYIIIFQLEAQSIIIYSVFNTWQHPGKKLLRVKK